MKNQKSVARSNNSVIKPEDRLAARSAVRQTLDEKYSGQFLDITMDAGRHALHMIKENAGDYKEIGQDKTMTPVDKALGKRKVLAADIGIGLGTGGGILGLIWLGKKVFTS